MGRIYNSEEMGIENLWSEEGVTVLIEDAVLDREARRQKKVDCPVHPPSRKECVAGLGLAWETR